MTREKWTEERLNALLTAPSQALIEDMKRLDGDIMVLGAGGKMGPSLCVLAANAIRKAGIGKRVIAVSRGSDAEAAAWMSANGVEIVRADLLDAAALRALPDVPNVIFMAGRKFGTNGNEWQTWAMNSVLPALVTDRFRSANFVAFSSGNVFPLVPTGRGGCTEADRPDPVGEYAMSCLARERTFEYASQAYGTKVFLYRLNFAVDLRYGVVYDVAKRIMSGEPISLKTPVFNFIWQGSANEIALRGLLRAESPMRVMNVTGPETVSIRETARELGKYLGREPLFDGEEGTDAYISDAGAAMEEFGYPAVSAHTLIRWQAEWLLDGGRTLDKPTHFEERGGKY